MSQAVHLRKYGVEAVVNFELYEIDGVDLKTDAADGGTDCNIMKDQGAEATCDNDFVDEGSGYSITITATEMEGAQITLYIIDSATKVYLDKVIHIETYGNASAMHAMDLDDADGSTLTEVGGDGAQLTEAGGDGDHLAEAGGDGDQLTAINLPNQTMDITGNLSGSVGSVSGAVGSVAGNVDGLVTGTVAGKTPAEAGDAMNLAADAIKAVSYDESTAFPVKADDAGATQIARVGADSDTLETLSDEIAAVKAETASIQTETTAIDALTKAAGDGDLAAIKVITDALTAAGAAKLALGATTMITGIVSWDNTNATTTVIYSSDIIEATADHFNGRLFVPTSGALLGQYTDITDYALDTGEGKFTVTALTEAPADNTTFVIL